MSFQNNNNPSEIFINYDLLNMERGHGIYSLFSHNQKVKGGMN